MADGEAARAPGPALRLRDLWRRRQHARAHPRTVLRIRARDRARARGASHLHRRQPRPRSTRSRGAIGRRASAISWRCAATSPAGEGALPAASRRLSLCRRAGRGAAARRRFRDQRRRLSRDPSRGRERRPPISTISSARSMPAPPAPSPSSSSMSSVYLRFLDRAAAAGISRADRAGHPAGDAISPRCEKFAAACGAALPAWMAPMFDGLDDDPDTRRLVAASIAAEQCRLLQAAGINEFHFYTLNRADLIVAICHMIGVRGSVAAAHQQETEPMPHILDYLARPRAAVRRRHGDADAGAPSRCRARLSRPRELHRHPVREPARSRARDPYGLSARRRRRGADQQLRRLAGDAGRVRHRRQGLRHQPPRRPSWRARRSTPSPATAARASSSARSAPARGCPRSAISTTRRSRTRSPCNAAAWSPAGSMRILVETCQDTLQIKAAVNAAKRARAEAGKDIADLRPGDGRDHRHAAGRRRHRGGGHRHPARSTCR